MVHTCFSIEGKKAIVTGASRGLGFAMAKGLHEAGAEVVLISRNAETLEKALEEISPKRERIHFVVGDMSQLEHIPEIYQKALDCLGGRLDILINCAGLQYRCPAADYPMDKWLEIINTNLNGVFVLTQLAGRQMIQQKSGKIINIASMTSFFGSVLTPAYSAAKGGIVQLTKALSNEWAQYGINVNAIAPGYMETKLTADIKTLNPEQYAEITRRIPARRWGQPEDMIGTAIFLASDASNYISGAVIPIDGGYLGK